MKNYFELAICSILTTSVLFLTACGSDNNDEPNSPTDNNEDPTQFIPSDELAYYFTYGIDIDSYGDNVSTTFTCNKSWSTTSSEDWCIISPSRGDAGNHTINICIAPNETLDSRNAVVSIIINGQNNYIAVRQESATSGKIHVEIAGTLSSLLTEEASIITELKLSGNLNGSDIKFLRDICKNIISLDITDVTIVEGGDEYCSNCFTSNNVLPACFFAWNHKIRNIKLPKSINSIGESAFFDCRLHSIEIPDNVKTLGLGVFSNCTSLESIKLPKNLRSIPSSTFSNCSNLRQLTIPESVDSICSLAFWNCTSLSEIALNEGLKVIDHSAFSYCSSLKNITIPKTVDDAYWAFQNCENLEEVTLYEGVENAGMVFYQCGIRKATLYHKDLDSTIFFLCDKLETLILKEGLEYINFDLTDFPKLKELTLPSTINKMGSKLFGLLSDTIFLEKLHLKAKTPPTTYQYQEEDCNQCTLYVPRGYKDAYISAGAPWIYFKNIIEE